jgi:hypothetical protein
VARNPLRSESEAFRFLVVVLVGAVLVLIAALINTWLGVAVAVLAVAGIVWWVLQEPVPGAEDRVEHKVDPSTPGSAHRVLVVAPPSTPDVRVPDRATDIVVVVPALSSTVEALTGAVDDRRSDAEQTALSLTRRLSRPAVNVRGEVGADDPLLAVDDALRTFGADEIVIVGDEELVEQIRGRVTVPVSRA